MTTATLDISEVMVIVRPRTKRKEDSSGNERAHQYSAAFQVIASLHGTCSASRERKKLIRINRRGTRNVPAELDLKIKDWQRNLWADGCFRLSFRIQIIFIQQRFMDVIRGGWKFLNEGK